MLQSSMHLYSQFKFCSYHSIDYTSTQNQVIFSWMKEKWTSDLKWNCMLGPCFSTINSPHNARISCEKWISMRNKNDLANTKQNIQSITVEQFKLYFCLTKDKGQFERRYTISHKGNQVYKCTGCPHPLYPSRQQITLFDNFPCAIFPTKDRVNTGYEKNVFVKNITTFRV